MTGTVTAWRDRGETIEAEGYAIWLLDTPAANDQSDPLVVLHGFPSSSFDWSRARPPGRAPPGGAVRPGWLRPVRQARPPLGIELYADIAQGVIAHLGLQRVALATHDLGDTVGGELLARILDGVLDLEVTGRLITNGSIYMDLVQLTAGQELLLSLPDERWTSPPSVRTSTPPLPTVEGLAQTFADAYKPSEEELAVQFELASHQDGYSLLPPDHPLHRGPPGAEARYTGRSSATRHRSGSSGATRTRSPATRWPSASRSGSPARLRDPRWSRSLPDDRTPERFADAAVDLLNAS